MDFQEMCCVTGIYSVSFRRIFQAFGYRTLCQRESVGLHPLQFCQTCIESVSTWHLVLAPSKIITLTRDMALSRGKIDYPEQTWFPSAGHQTEILYNVGLGYFYLWWRNPRLRARLGNSLPQTC